MLVNGKQYPHRPGLTLHAVIAEFGLRHSAIVVMRGDEIYKRGNIPDVELQPDDRIEIIRMMQGG